MNEASEVLEAIKFLLEKAAQQSQNPVDHAKALAFAESIAGLGGNVEETAPKHEDHQLPVAPVETAPGQDQTPTRTRSAVKSKTDKKAE